MQPFDFIKGNIIWKLAYEAKYIRQINGGLMFFENSRIILFKLAGLIVNIMERINTTMIIPIIFIVLFCCKKAHDSKEFSCEYSKTLPWIINHAISQTLYIRKKKKFLKYLEKIPIRILSQNNWTNKFLDDITLISIQCLLLKTLH